MVRRPIQSGVQAAFVASVAMAALMIVRGVIGLAPEFSMLGALNAIIDQEATLVAGWFAFFAVYTLLGGAVYALLEPTLPGRSATAHGFVFGLGIWVVMMLLLMPSAGFGIFGAAGGPAAPLLSLVLHLVYGVLLGGFYGWLVHRHPAPAADAWPGRRDH